MLLWCLMHQKEVGNVSLLYLDTRRYLVFGGEGVSTSAVHVEVLIRNCTLPKDVVPVHSMLALILSKRPMK